MPVQVIEKATVRAQLSQRVADLDATVAKVRALKAAASTPAQQALADVVLDLAVAMREILWLQREAQRRG